jgi:hypothetical protein
MFNAEPQEKFTPEEIAEFEAYAAEFLRTRIRGAFHVGLLLLAIILSIVPFSKSHSLHSHAEPYGRYLIWIAEGVFVWFVIRVGAVWAAWCTARETRREFRDID